jgi:hypothetical protein
MRMNVHRIANADDEEEYIRRPMASLMTSTTPTASSNITMISSSDAQVNEKSSKNKNQSIPNAQDFPALPSTYPTSNPSSNSSKNILVLLLL